MVTIFPIAVWAAALVAAAIGLFLAIRGASAPKEPIWRTGLQQLLRYVFIFPLGVMGLWAFLGHALFPERAAAAIGWAPSPFQFEVALANLGIAVGSFYAAFSTRQAKLAMGLMAACFLCGAGYGHIHDILTGDNYAPGNAGPILFTDFLTPIVALVLLALVWREPKQAAAERGLAETPAGMAAVTPEIVDPPVLPRPKAPRGPLQPEGFVRPQGGLGGPSPIRPHMGPDMGSNLGAGPMPAMGQPPPMPLQGAANGGMPRLEDELESMRRSIHQAMSKDMKKKDAEHGAAAKEGAEDSAKIVGKAAGKPAAKMAAPGRRNGPKAKGA